MAGGHLAPGGRPGCGGGGGGAGPACAPHGPPLAPSLPGPGSVPSPRLYLAVPGVGTGAPSQPQLRPGSRRHPRPATNALPGVGGKQGRDQDLGFHGDRLPPRRGCYDMVGRPPLRPALPRPGGFPAPPAALRRPHRPPWRQTVPPLSQALGPRRRPPAQARRRKKAFTTTFSTNKAIVELLLLWFSFIYRSTDTSGRERLWTYLALTSFEHNSAGSYT
ncbi:uncharacterized protein LOC141948144 [Strix uralensis]|uniref:uncharacterized protein LOC141948144 n=1 Tax=Strix uralensis TaxID=36305 RepID=UPI003DA2FC93